MHFFTTLSPLHLLKNNILSINKLQHENCCRKHHLGEIRFLTQLLLYQNSHIPYHHYTQTTTTLYISYPSYPLTTLLVLSTSLLADNTHPSSSFSAPHTPLSDQRHNQHGNRWNYLTYRWDPIANRCYHSG